MEKGRPASKMSLRGRIETVYFASPTFSAGRLRTLDGKVLSFAGRLFAQIGEQVILKGAWGVHATYGPQFQVETEEFDLDLDADGLAHYLASNPTIKGIGPAKARIIADAFGRDFDRVLTQEPVSHFPKFLAENPENRVR